VKLLFDENLPPRLADVLQGEFPESVHVHSCGLGSSEDEAIWEYAKREGFTIVSSCAWQPTEGHLAAHSKFIDDGDRRVAPVILQFIADPEETLLVLNRR